MKKILIILTCWATNITFAQQGDPNAGTGAADFKPEAGNISAALLLGRGNFITTGLDVPPSSNFWNFSGGSGSVPGSAPYVNPVEANSNDITNMIGLEFRYFLAENIAVKLSGGAILRNTPQRPNVPAFIDPDSDPAAWIPAYQAVRSENRRDVNINIGGEYHFTTQVSRLFPYGGVTIPLYYGSRTLYDPTFETDPNNPDNFTIVDVGIRTAEIGGFGIQAVAGIDYYLMEGLYLGVETKPIGYIYAFSVKVPAPGLPALNADTHTYSFFAQTFFKLGFRF